MSVSLIDFVYVLEFLLTVFLYPVAYCLVLVDSMQHCIVGAGPV